MKKVITVILDGFGINEKVEGNAVALADCKNFNKLWNEYPHSTLYASEEYVGLKKGQFGNSETGHLTIGGGRLIKQGSQLIDEMFENDLTTNEIYQEMIDYVNDGDKSLHLMYMCSNGGVHSMNGHAINMLKCLKNSDVQNVYIHLISDGRDSDSKSFPLYLKELTDAISEIGIGTISSLCGRYYAMDRDNNYDRTSKYYNLVVGGVGLETLNLNIAVDASYDRGVTDEFIQPILFNNKGLIKNGDCLVWLNFRGDRTRQIMESFNDDFDKFPTANMKELKIYSFFEHVDTRIVPFVQKNYVENPLGVYLSEIGMTQSRIAETEKYAHVTYFFDGGRDVELPKCNRVLIPSPKVDTYDLQPQMSAVEVTKAAMRAMADDDDFILVNYANPDMVGHTGNLDATISGLRVMDLCLGKLKEVADENFYTMFILADHGNAECMVNEDGGKITTHTINKVPFIITDNKVHVVDGDLTNVAPTILKYFDIALPKEMKDTEDLFHKEEE